MAYPDRMADTCHHCGHDIDPESVGASCGYCGRAIPPPSFAVFQERTLPLNRLGQRKPLPDPHLP